METLQYFHNPTISESLGNGWFTMKKYFFWLLLVLIICSLFDSRPDLLIRPTTSPLHFSGMQQLQ